MSQEEKGVRHVMTILLLRIVELIFLQNRYLLCEITRSAIRNYCFIESYHTDMPAGDKILYI